MIKITSAIDGYRRCGVTHPAAPTEYPDEVFTEEQLEVLKNTPVLQVEVSDPEAPPVPPVAPDQGAQENDDPQTGDNNLDKMTVAELKEMAEKMGLTVPAKAAKKELIELIRQGTQSSPDPVE